MKLSIKKYLAVAALVAGAISAQASTVNMVANGSFELPELNSTPSWRVVTGAALAGWTAGMSGVEVRREAPRVAQHGSQFVELDRTQGGWISQVINTVEGNRYSLSFWYSPAVGQSSASGNWVEVFWNGQMVRTLEGVAANNWGQYWVSLVGGPGTNTLRFAAAGNSKGSGGSLDNVELAAVPLPGAALLFATALAGFFGFSNRRKV